MPELPEVETVCRGLAAALTGKRILDMQARRADLRTPLPPDLSDRLKGRTIKNIYRRAKYILITLDKNLTLLLHLGMSGRMTIDKRTDNPHKHDHLLFHFADHLTLSFNDPRRFGLCDLVATDEVEQHKWLRHVGIEPLSDDLTPGFLATALKGKTASIKDALLDQRIIAGIGNIYASEALFRAGVRPTRKAGAVKQAELVKLVPAIRTVLNAAIAAGRSTLRDYKRADGGLGYFQHQFAVYGKEGQACTGCTCDIAKTGGVERITQGGRSSFFCPRKQV